ncbi:nucleoside phosphorylase [Kibdelosporangium banguiense]|uniref:Nucleoside phosphorylase n=1 Tax=Kibdelosporangium banguiense TaxID=1365924 RepID=A0ABS4TRQ5_9PSEU|nr:nucleoside phosphorylase [Kibdelosporangium banguiense]
MSDMNGDVDAVLLTALDLEYSAIRAHLINIRTQVHPIGTHFETGTVPGTSTRVAIAAAGEGNRAAAVLVERANALFRPNIALFIGIAGALHTDIELGDVVVATRVYGYHGGKAEPGEFLTRPRAWDSPHELLQHARYLSRTRWWCHFSPHPADHPPYSIHFRPIAAGDVVLDTPTGPLVDLIRRHYNDVAAIEMESAGAAEAAHLNGPLPLLTIRGISDRADGQKEVTDASGSQQLASAHAAEFALALLTRFGNAGQPGKPKQPPASDRISIGVGGDISGQLVIGTGNQVTWSRPPPDRPET